MADDKAFAGELAEGKDGWRENKSISINRNEIIDFLKRFSEGKEYVHAMWLEGADGLNRVDEYSDIDFWFDVDQEFQEAFLYECIEELKKLGNIDSRVDQIRKEIAQSNVHLENTTEYMTLDLCVQSHEIRGREVTCFVKDDIAELPLVVFDKANIITYRDGDFINLEEMKSIFDNQKNRIMQMSRVKKYVRRNQYLEAYGKFIENIAEPLVTIARLIYTPRHYDYLLCHINDHLPKDVVKELEPFFQVESLKDIERNLELASRLLETYERQFIQKYGF